MEITLTANLMPVYGGTVEDTDEARLLEAVREMRRSRKEGERVAIVVTATHGGRLQIFRQVQTRV